MKYITVNPTWNVPPSIIRNEYLPALARDPNALARVGLQVGRNPDGSIRIFQPPGERNALGRIRFNFPNRFLVYQHDTPDKKLFAHDARAYSHGCMRVQNPDEYAEVLLGVSQPEEKYTAARIRSMYGTSERTINFKRPIPVYITYQTAFADDAGKPQTRADIYGLDRDLLNILRGDRRNSDTPIARNYNSGSKPVMSSAAGTARGRDSGLGRGQDSGFTTSPGYTTWNSDTPMQNFRSAFQPSDRTGPGKTARSPETSKQGRRLPTAAFSFASSPGWRGRPGRWRRWRSRTASAAPHTCAACRRYCRRR